MKTDRQRLRKQKKVILNHIRDRKMLLDTKENEFAKTIEFMQQEINVIKAEIEELERELDGAAKKKVSR